MARQYAPTDGIFYIDFAEKVQPEFSSHVLHFHDQIDFTAKDLPQAKILP